MSWPSATVVDDIKLAVGASDGELELLRLGQRAAYRLTRDGASSVVRLSRPSTPLTAVAREMFVARRLAAAGVATVSATAVVGTIPDGHFTVWSYIEEASPYGYGDLPVLGEVLARVHTVAADAIPRWAPLRRAETRLLALPPRFMRERDALLPLLGPLRNRAAMLARKESVLLLGDAHIGNIIRGPRGPVVIDLEAACVGPREVDIAPTALSVRRFGAPIAPAVALAARLGRSLNEPDVETATDVKEMSSVCWLAQLVDASPAHEDEFRHRVRTLLSEDETSSWTAL